MVERVECGPDTSGARSDACREGFDSDVIRTTSNTVVRFELIEFSLESLILAQDERWRRA